MKNYIDTHIHFDLFKNPFEMLDYYEKNKIYSIFVTNLPEYFVRYSAKMKQYKYIKLAIGFHPGLIQNDKFNLEIFKKNVLKTKYVGEIGLDFSNNNSDFKNKQIYTLDLICKECKNKILSVHSRKAEEEIYQTLKSNNMKFIILHWYTGSIKTLEKLINIGCYFSVNGNMLKSKNGIKILEKIPLNKILFETDAPFTSKKIDLKYFQEIHSKFNDFYKINNFRDLVYENFKKLLINNNKLSQ